jgi:hypothetical protein
VSADPGGPLDDIDVAILAQVYDVFDRLDPPPETLIDQVSFALDLADLDVEVARLQDDALIGSGSRSGARTRTLTFEASAFSLLVSITALDEDNIRLDGWLSPAGAGQVELRQAAADQAGRAAGSVIRQATPDEAGRFVFDNLSHGLIQIRIHPGTGADGGVVTPSIPL